MVQVRNWGCRDLPVRLPLPLVGEGRGEGKYVVVEDVDADGGDVVTWGIPEQSRRVRICSADYDGTGSMHKAS